MAPSSAAAPARSAALDQLAAECQRLYSLPAVALEVLQLTRDPQVDAARLKRCIERDPGLTARVLRVVNSSLFGLARPVRDLNQALALLGSKPLKLLVLGFTLPDRLFTGLAGDVLTRYWRRTLIRAVAAREICEQVWFQPGDEAFLAGLLQDVGILALVQQLREPYVALVRKAWERGDDLAPLERMSLGFDHAQLTSRLLAQWGLAPSLVDAVLAPGDPDRLDNVPEPSRTLPKALHLADRLARSLAERRLDALADLIALGHDYHGLSTAQWHDLIDALAAKVGELAQLLDLNLPEDEGLATTLAQARDHLADAGEDLVRDVLRERLSAGPEAAAEEQLLSEVAELRRAAERRVPLATPRAPLAPPVPQTGTGPTVVPLAPPVPSTDKRVPLALPVPSISTGPAALQAELESALAACREARSGLSLLLVAVDRWRDLAAEHGADAAARLLAEVRAACGELGAAGARVLPLDAARLAVVMPGYDRRAAASEATELLRQVRRLAEGPAGSTMAISVGAATVDLPARNFPAPRLVEAAGRCLFAAQAAGGNTLKSIEIY